MVGTVGARRGGSHGSKQYGDIGGGWWPAPPEAMIILSWNVRGLGNPRAFQALRKILQLHSAQLVFLCETNVSTMQMNVIANKLSFENCLAVSCNGRGDGITMLWKSDIGVQMTGT